MFISKYPFIWSTKILIHRKVYISFSHFIPYHSFLSFKPLPTPPPHQSVSIETCQKHFSQTKLAAMSVKNLKLLFLLICWCWVLCIILANGNIVKCSDFSTNFQEITLRTTIKLSTANQLFFYDSVRKIWWPWTTFFVIFTKKILLTKVLFEIKHRSKQTITTNSRFMELKKAFNMVDPVQRD